MVVALRLVGLPAAYASGYLRTYPPPGMSRLVGADAMHAWVMLWCGPTRGWIGRTAASDEAEGVTLTFPPAQNSPLFAAGLDRGEGAIVPLLRETIGTLASTTSAESLDDRAGPLHAVIAPGPARAFVLFDGARIARTDADGIVAVWESRDGVEVWRERGG